MNRLGDPGTSCHIANSLIGESNLEWNDEIKGPVLGLVRHSFSSSWFREIQHCQQIEGTFNGDVIMSLMIAAALFHGSFLQKVTTLAQSSPLRSTSL
jgi:hypothetical protein